MSAMERIDELKDVVARLERGSRNDVTELLNTRRHFGLKIKDESLVETKNAKVDCQWSNV
jgi:hypothetical protein